MRNKNIINNTKLNMDISIFRLMKFRLNMFFVASENFSIIVDIPYLPTPKSDGMG